MATAPARIGRMRNMSLLERESEWEAIKLRYITSKVGLRPLAVERNVNVHTLCRRAKREGWFAERIRLQALTLKTSALPTIHAAKPAACSPASEPAPWRFMELIYPDRVEIVFPPGAIAAENQGEITR